MTALSVAVAACGDGRTGGPRGAPQAVVEAAADRTLATSGARFEVAAPDGQRAGEMDFAGSGPLATGSAGGSSSGHPEMGNPRAIVDLVRGAIEAVSYGGAAVRGTSAFRYETVINVERAVRETPPPRRAEMEAFARQLGAPAFYADVWVDGEGRLLRVQVPVEKTTRRPAQRSRELPRLVTVDFFDFRA